MKIGAGKATLCLRMEIKLTQFFEDVKENFPLISKMFIKFRCNSVRETFTNIID
jgi:hypothetical protein